MSITRKPGLELVEEPPKKGGGTIFLVILNPLFVGPILSDLIHVFAHGLPPEFFFLRAPT